MAASLAASIFSLAASNAGAAAAFSSLSFSMAPPARPLVASPICFAYSASFALYASISSGFNLASHSLPLAASSAPLAMIGASFSLSPVLAASTALAARALYSSRTEAAAGSVTFSSPAGAAGAAGAGAGAGTVGLLSQDVRATAQALRRMERGNFFIVSNVFVWLNRSQRAGT